MGELSFEYFDEVSGKILLHSQTAFSWPEGSALGRPQTSRLKIVAENRHWDFPGFGPMTRIETMIGPFPAQTLRVGDRVRTREGTFAQIRWLDRVVLDEEFLHRHPEAQPVMVPAHAFGRDTPKSDILLSPGQKIFSERFLGRRGPRTAEELLDAGSAHRRSETMITYTMFICEHPVEVKVEGLWAPLEPPRW